MRNRGQQRLGKLTVVDFLIPGCHKTSSGVTKKQEGSKKEDHLTRNQLNKQANTNARVNEKSNSASLKYPQSVFKNSTIRQKLYS